MKSELIFAWNNIEKEISDFFQDLSRGIREDLMAFMKDMLKEFDDSLVTAYARGIDSRVRLVEYKVETIEGRFMRKYKAIRGYASEPFKNSYPFKEMLPTYRKASQITGMLEIHLL